MKSKIFVVFLLLTVVFTACESSIFTKGLKEGTIHYEISYFESDKDNPLITLLPTTMTIKFKNNSSVGAIEGWLGVFKSSYISNYETKKNHSLLKVMDKKFNYETNFNEPNFGFDEMPGLNVEITNQTKVIAGYTCKRAIATYGKEKKDTFSVYYTNDILISNPNWNNPFKTIDGVLMEFQSSMRNVMMKCVAVKVENNDIADTEFQVPAGYKTVSRQEFEKVVSDLMKNN